MIQRMKKAVRTFMLTASMNMAGILLVTQTGGIGAVLLMIAATLFFLYENIAPPAGDIGGSSMDTKRLKQLGRGCALVLYTGLTFPFGLL